MLPRVIDAVGARVPVLMDSGIRSGLDVLRAMACGAKATIIGRPWIWSVAARGEAGLLSLLYTFRGEMRVGMALTGAASLAEVDRDILDRAG
jgi:L-lactate dehydrogenase (cytochrome)